MILRSALQARWLAVSLGMAALAAFACRRVEDPAYSRSSTVIVAVCCNERAAGPNEDEPVKFLMFLPLLAETEKGELEGKLARRWEHSPDYREWTYHLRTDVRWHDGVPVTAHDVKFTLDFLTHPDVLGIAPGLIESVAVLDDSTVTIRSREPEDYQTWVVYYPKHLLEHLEPKAYAGWDFWTQPVGNGPYRYVRHVPNTLMELEANRDYYRGKPAIGRVVLKFSGDGNWSGPVTQLLSGEVDALGDADPVEIPQVARDSRFRVYYWLRPLTHAIYWQSADPLFKDARVRRALTLAIDRQQLLVALNLPETLPFYDGVFTHRQFRRGALPEPLPYDPKQTEQLLEDAGWRDVDGDGLRERNGQAFHFTALVSNYLEFQKTALFVQSQLRRVGVQMDIQILESSLISRRVQAGDFAAAFLRLGHSARWLERFLGRDTSLGYKNARFTDLIDRLQFTADPDARDEIYRELTDILRSDSPITFLFPVTWFYLTHRRILGLSSPFRADPAWHMEHLRLEDR
ncbi:MAG: ABC transporter substrate-binding protein [Gemmatimonadaceae bacterium]